MTIESSTGEGLNDSLDLSGDHIAAREVLIVKDSAEETFSQQMLYQHLIYCITAHSGIKRCAAQVKEGSKGSNKGFIFGVLVFDTLQETLCEIRNTLLEVLYRMLKGSDVWFSVVKESVKDICEFFRLLQVYFKNLFIVLIENGSTCVLKDSVSDWITCIDLFAYLNVKIVLGVFGFPVTTRQVEGIAQSAIRSFAVRQGLFGNEGPVG